MSGMNIDIAWLLPEGYASRGIPGHCMRMALEVYASKEHCPSNNGLVDSRCPH